jgi:hypothetical protein
MINLFTNRKCNDVIGKITSIQGDMTILLHDMIMTSDFKPFKGHFGGIIIQLHSIKQIIK